MTNNDAIAALEASVPNEQRMQRERMLSHLAAVAVFSLSTMGAMGQSTYGACTYAEVDLSTLTAVESALV